MFQPVWAYFDVAWLAVVTVIGATFQDYASPHLELEESTQSYFDSNCAKLLQLDELATSLPYITCAVILLCCAMIIFFTVSTVFTAIMCLA